MQTKEKLEQYLSRCMDSACDFAEIFEEFEENEMISTLDQKVEKGKSRLWKPQRWKRLFSICLGEKCQIFL